MQDDARELLGRCCFGERVPGEDVCVLGGGGREEDVDLLGCRLGVHEPGPQLARLLGRRAKEQDGPVNLGLRGQVERLDAFARRDGHGRVHPPLQGEGGEVLAAPSGRHGLGRPPVNCRAAGACEREASKNLSSGPGREVRGMGGCAAYKVRTTARVRQLLA